MKNIFYILLSGIITLNMATAQEPPPPEFIPQNFELAELKTDSLAADSLSAPADSVLADSLLHKPQKSDLDTTIYYDAASIFTDIDARTTILTGKAVIKYKNMTLSAEKITLDWNQYLITAEPVVDSVWVPSDSAGTDSVLQVEWRGYPELSEGGEPYQGSKMMYNYKTEKGLVVKGRTEMEGGFYNGQQIKRVDSDVFHIKNSSYTTCDLDSNPHFHFESRKLKMIMKDKAIAKPVIMYFGKIPIAAIPFAIFPTKTGRQSGILIPTYSESSQEGRALRGLGYYWAPNDYFDANMKMDYFEKSGFLFHGASNYKIRYLLHGTITGSYTRKNFSGNKTRRWDLRVNHNQDIDPTSSITVSGYFVSDKDFYKNFSTNLNTRLTRELRSNATYHKSWPKQKLSLSVNMSQVHDLQDNLTQQTFPQVSFRKNQTQIFKPKKKSGRGRSTGSRRDPQWYENLYFSYSSKLTNQSSEFFRYETNGDTLKDKEETRTMSHDFKFTLTSPKKYFGWLSLNQSLNINEDWFDETDDYSFDWSDSTIASETAKGFAARHMFDYSSNATTKLYGMFAPGIGDIQAIRHVVTPTLSFNYRPDFSDPTWGYYKEIETEDGTEKRDRFGGTFTTGQKSLRLSVHNLFQMKRGYGEEEKKTDLFSMTFNTGYNFEAEQNKLSDLSSIWRANPASNFSLNAKTTHSFYKWLENEDKPNGYRSNTYLMEGDGWKRGSFLRMTNLNLRLNFRVKGAEKKQHNKEQESSSYNSDSPIDEEPDPLLEEEDLSIVEEELLKKSNRFENEMAIRSFDIPWQASLSFTFNINKTNPNLPKKNYYMDLSSAEINLTRKWRIGYSAHYDIVRKQISHHRFTFYRDLHCWEGSVDWVPSGPSKSVYAIIRIKSSVLKDVKIEKRGGAQSLLGY